MWIGVPAVLVAVLIGVTRIGCRHGRRSRFPGNLMRIVDSGGAWREG